MEGKEVAPRPPPSKGSAHIGVIQVLEEHVVSIDVVAAVGATVNDVQRQVSTMSRDITSVVGRSVGR